MTLFLTSLLLATDNQLGLKTQEAERHWLWFKTCFCRISWLYRSKEDRRVTGQLPWGQLPHRTISPIGQLPRGQLPPGQLPPRTITPVGQLPPGQFPLLVGQLPPRTITPIIFICGWLSSGVIVLPIGGITPRAIVL